ncbi:MAG: tRNA (guanosine(46)-N7)-methyltransferase TrmB [Deltaproteobacteria bacterium]|nr:tRNA (guanosine(46)-N7)-methyltransferase TrmB [Deltaproteobacteria bacterium]
MANPPPSTAKGLIGGDLETRARLSRVPPVDHPLVLAPYRKDGDEALTRAFLDHHPLHVEIGFGRPHHPIDLARLLPEAHVLGFEIKRQWVRAAAERAAREGLANLRVIEGDARPHIERLVTPGTVDAIHILFPDPWWKKRHHKRRVFNADFVALLVACLAPGGMLIAKTDVEAYADELVAELGQAGLALAGSGTADATLASLPRSHREKKCEELGIPVFRFRFVLSAPPTSPGAPSA